MKKIIIIGAGISGLYLANLLEKSGNFDYKILEKKNNFSIDQGYGIQLSVNGVKLLNKIGFRKIAISNINYPKNINFYEAKNCNLISSIKISKFNDKENYYTTLKRSVLINFLLKKIPKEKILFGSNIKSIYENNDLKINLENNNFENADYLVISDGIFSKSKGMILNNNKIKFYNSVALRGTFNSLKDSDISVYLGPNFHFVTYPVNQNNESNFISILREKSLKKIKTSDKKELISNYLRFISQKSKSDLLSKINNTSLYPIYVSNNFSKPKSNKIFLAGDALFAHPPSFAQGASQSIEASYEVFKNLGSASNNYYKNREIRTKNVQSRANLNYFAFHVSNPITIFLRNLGLKYLIKNEIFMNNFLGKIYK